MKVFALVTIIFFTVLAPAFGAKGDFYVVGDENRNTEAALKQLAVIEYLQKRHFDAAAARVTPQTAEKFVQFFQRGLQGGYMTMKGTLEIAGLDEFGQRYGGASQASRNIRLIIQGVTNIRTLKQIEAVLAEQDFIQEATPKEAFAGGVVFSVTSTRSPSDIANSLRIGKLASARWETNGESTITATLTQ